MAPGSRKNGLDFCLNWLISFGSGGGYGRAYKPRPKTGIR
jgi:hypothetical protein